MASELFPSGIGRMVRRGKTQVLLAFLTLLPLTFLTLSGLIGIYKLPGWSTLVALLLALLIAAFSAVRVFIRWRLQTHQHAGNKAQLYLLAQLSGLAPEGFPAALLTALSSKLENHQWQELKQVIHQQASEALPLPPPAETAVTRSTIKTSLPFWVALMGAVFSWAATVESFFSLLPFLIALVWSGAAFLLGARFLRAINNRKPALILSPAGMQLPGKTALLNWAHVSEEAVIKVQMGKGKISKLQYRYQAKKNTFSISTWNVTSGELKYLLLWYRHAYEAK